MCSSEITFETRKVFPKIRNFPVTQPGASTSAASIYLLHSLKPIQPAEPLQKCPFDARNPHPIPACRTKRATFWWASRIPSQRSMYLDQQRSGRTGTYSIYRLPERTQNDLRWSRVCEFLPISYLQKVFSKNFRKIVLKVFVQPFLFSIYSKLESAFISNSRTTKSAPAQEFLTRSSCSCRAMAMLDSWSSHPWSHPPTPPNTTVVASPPPEVNTCPPLLEPQSVCQWTGTNKRRSNRSPILHLRHTHLRRHPELRRQLRHTSSHHLCHPNRSPTLKTTWSIRLPKVRFRDIEVAEVLVDFRIYVLRTADQP